ncbi:MAG: TIM barrel protein, partial [Rhizobiaceae bacterium]|nr:TIM barrel protein [Rhizobiaceae bacterium]
MSDISFALNHMCAPKLTVQDFFSMARSLGCNAVEIRNDLDGNAILDGTPADQIKAEADRRDIRILSINALQRFNEWNETRAAEAAQLIDYAKRVGAQGLVLVPTNDGTGTAPTKRRQNLRQALAALKPMLEAADIIGFVEPLGFESCSLRSKTEAVEAIKELSAENRFKLVHDTFHHYLAGEDRIYAGMTGLVHISGVEDPSLDAGAMRDAHRKLVGAQDRIGNVEQINRLQAMGYRGLYSFEPFASEVHALASPAEALSASIAFLRAETGHSQTAF